MRDREEDQFSDLLTWEPRIEGTETADPRSDRDTSALPTWWRAAVDEFEAHDLPPYRPPRFADGVLKQRVEGELEDVLGVEVDTALVEADERWMIRVDREPIAEIGHHRHRDGYSVYEMSSSEFAQRVVDHVCEAGCDS